MSVGKEEFRKFSYEKEIEKAKWLKEDIEKGLTYLSQDFIFMLVPMWECVYVLCNNTCFERLELEKIMLDGDKDQKFNIIPSLGASLRFFIALNLSSSIRVVFFFMIYNVLKNPAYPLHFSLFQSLFWPSQYISQTVRSTAVDRSLFKPIHPLHISHSTVCVPLKFCRASFSISVDRTWNCLERNWNILHG